MRKYTLCTVFLFFVAISFQGLCEEPRQKRGYAGFGLGHTYGGFGVRVSDNLSEKIGFFLGTGYYLVGFGYNIGLMYLFPRNTAWQGYFSAMYGTNSAIKIVDSSRDNKVYSGGSIGLGMKMKTKKGTYFDIGVVLPFTPSSYKENLNYWKKRPDIEVKEPWPVSINIGYHIKLK